jgi:tetratricopeptide (TPR) repeat protein
MTILGLISDKIGRMRDYDKALELNPRFTEAYIQKAAAKRQEGDLLGALEDINIAIKIESKNGRLFSIRGDFKKDLNLLKDACGDWSLAIDMGYLSASYSIKKFCN